MTSLAQPILAAYLDATRSLTDLMSVREGLVDMEQLERLQDERDRLIALHDQLPESERAQDSLRPLLQDISKLDDQFRANLTALHAATQRKLGGLKETRRVSDAYTDTFEYGAAFIDRKK